MINELAKKINDNAKSKGFWDAPRNTGEMLMLIVSEISEALEADRVGKYCDWTDGLPPISDNLSDRDFKDAFAGHVKNSFEDELADAMIRIMDLAYSKKFDLEWHIKNKMRYNSLRPHMHGKKY